MAPRSKLKKVEDRISCRNYLGALKEAAKVSFPGLDERQSIDLIVSVLICLTAMRATGEKARHFKFFDELLDKINQNRSQSQRSKTLKP